MKNQVIEVLNLEHGQKVIKYWKSKGVKNASAFLGTYTKEAGESHRYYGIINNHFSNYSENTVRQYNAEIITLLTFPRKMLVWDYHEKNAIEKIVIRDLGVKVKNRYIAVNTFNVEDYEEGNKFSVTTWNYAKELSKINSKKQELLNKADELIQNAKELKEQAEEL